MEESKEKELLVEPLEKFLHFQEVILGKSYNTIRGYRKDIMQFVDYISGNEEIFDYNKVEVFTVRSFIAYSSSNEVGKRSINRKISALRTFFAYLKEQNIVETNKLIYVNMPKFEKELPTVLTKEDINKLRNVIDISKVTGIRDRLIIEFLYSSGLRSSELVSLSELMVNLEEREVRVLGKGNKERITFFSENARKWYEKYISAKRNEYKNYTPNIVFVNSRGERITTRSLRRLIADYAEKAGINKEVTPHVFRHSFATTLLNNKVDIRYLQELLGHSSISTTQVYTHVSKALLREIYIKAHPLADED